VFWSNEANSCLTAVIFPITTCLFKKMLPMESICTGSGNTKRASQQKNVIKICSLLLVVPQDFKLTLF
jgi:hypothetical protein